MPIITITQWADAIFTFIHKPIDLGNVGVSDAPQDGQLLQKSGDISLRRNPTLYWLEGHRYSDILGGSVRPEHLTKLTCSKKVLIELQLSRTSQ